MRPRYPPPQVHVLARSASKLSAAQADGLTPWMRDLANVAQGDLRRLNQVEQLLHSYLMLARLRHDDDYSRVSICLSLVATIFLPLSFARSRAEGSFVDARRGLAVKTGIAYRSRASSA